MSQSATTLLSARPSILYRVALAMVAVTMAVLPVVYVALTALAIWGVYLFATRYFLSIWAVPGIGRSAIVVKTLLSCTPLVVGSAAAFFMVKPLFARRRTRVQPLVLTPGDEPRVHALVDEVCRLVGARTPRRIELSCVLNASASLENGVRGFFGDGLILTLGLPLVAGLTQRELAGVVAHEFRHFRQGAGMRVTYMIRLVNGWFERVIYARDRWDAAVARLSEQTSHFGVQIVMLWVRFGVGFSRGVLWLLMTVGRGVSAGLSRQMEYDADRAEIAVAGSGAFESTSVKLVVLGSVFEDIALYLRRSWRTKFQLPDNLPGFLAYRAQNLTLERRTRLENKAGLGKTGIFDSHPSTADRVRLARRLTENGRVFSDAPARELFANFDGLSRLVTLAHYEDHFNVPVTPDFLIPLEKVLETEAAKLADASPPTRQRKAVPLIGYEPGRF